MCIIFPVVQSLSCIWLFATLWTAAHLASLSFTISRSLLKLMSIESVMPYNHLVLCHPLLLLPSVFPSSRAFSYHKRCRISLPVSEKGLLLSSRSQPLSLHSKCPSLLQQQLPPLCFLSEPSHLSALSSLYNQSFKKRYLHLFSSFSHLLFTLL